LPPNSVCGSARSRTITRNRADPCPPELGGGRGQSSPPPVAYSWLSL
jgi:hypothetical protein